MTAQLPVADFMQRQLLECEVSTPVGEAAARMRDARCGSIVVMADGKPAGIWTETDALAGRWHSARDLDQPVSRFMSSPVRTILPQVSLEEAARRLRLERLRHLLVVDAEGVHLGMISQTDVVRHQGVAFFLHARDVASVVKEAPLCIAADTSFNDVRDLMFGGRLEALVVHDGDRSGIITPRDVVGALGHRQIDLVAHELASFPLLTISSAATLYQARDVFAENRIRHLGVLDKEGALIGLLSIGDILDSVEHEYVRDLLTQIERQTARLEHTQRESARQISITDAIINALPINVYVKDEAGRVIIANRMTAQLLGQPMSGILGRHAEEIEPKAIAGRLFDSDDKVRLENSTLVTEEEFPDGRTFLAHKCLVEVDGAPLLIGTALDVSDWKRADALMVSGHHVLEMIAVGADLPAILEALCLRMENHLPGALCSVLLLDEEGQHLRHGAAPSLPADYSKAIDGVTIGPRVGSCGAAAYTGKQVFVEDIAVNPFWADYRQLAESHGLRACWSTPFFSVGRKVLGTFAIYYREPRSPDAHSLRVIAHAARLASVAVERRQQLSELRRLATIDQLTGLSNRAHFLDQAEAELQRAVRSLRKLTVLMIDIDHFKQINDSYGHAVGDEALRAFSRMLKKETRTVDHLGRLGGEEFATLLPETGLEVGLQVAERLRAAAEKVVFATGPDSQAGFTISIGVALYGPGDELDALLARADHALYRAKHEGRNRVVSS